MQISGTGISTFTVGIQKGYKVRTNLSLQWAELSDGNFFAIDRGASQDRYGCDVTLVLREDDINEFIEEINANRTAGSNEVTLGGFATTNERIFGADVDHSGSITATVTSIGRKKQKTFGSYTVNASFRAISPSFVGTSQLPTLNITTGYSGDSTVTIDKLESYDSTYTYLDSEKDAGMLDAVFWLLTDDMEDIRRYLATQRGADITISSIGGVTSPFGPRRGGFPITVKAIDWEDMGMFTLTHHRIRLRLAEVI